MSPLLSPETEVHTVEEVLEALDAIVARSIHGRSRIGYFAAIYRKGGSQGP